VLYDESDEDVEFSSQFIEKNIGLYQKSGHCYSDIKSFIPQVVCITLVALWFSDKKSSLKIESMEQKNLIISKRK
jgi:hypothetical protein